ncbi:DUF1569 domain-containing protein [Psychrosphaera sp. B3R10]|uniref:DUF1569 domain-containing protein n=1 Tax=unclassified Psychrosphaera TaxID=2641570 RepID=UPI001C09EC8A|nr:MULTISPECIES: DUF1569 domain-containing protein [unclassified Psychrosphaera]MBU2882600.1 DUF1569 domain-containing protein [Psychrosphaera sp. I2R16]MBU2989381.1 DUF1569 domain-containing protein [Psychrosphaera sp. B3R10]
MNRRQFIKGSIVTSGIAISGIVGLNLFINKVSKDKLTTEYALTVIDRLSRQELSSSGVWEPYQIFMHCAQSIEYSMTKFPVHKSRVFKETIGKLAFSAFEHKGQMTHSLSEPIPGAPNIAQHKSAQVALTYLRNTLVAFDQYQGQLAPHFAYGALTKREFEMAHIMHLNNHLDEIIS